MLNADVTAHLHHPPLPLHLRGKRWRAGVGTSNTGNAFDIFPTNVKSFTAVQLWSFQHHHEGCSYRSKFGKNASKKQQEKKYC